MCREPLYSIQDLQALSFTGFTVLLRRVTGSYNQNLEAVMDSFGTRSRDVPLREFASGTLHNIPRSPHPCLQLDIGRECRGTGLAALGPER